MRLIIPLFFFFLPILLQAQDPADIFHKTIDLDSINQVSLKVFAEDNFEVRPWPGDDILIETSVVLNNGESHILKFFLEKERWVLNPEVSGDRMVLASKDTTRRVVQGTEGTTSETVNIVVYMPESFSQAGDSWQRKR